MIYLPLSLGSIDEVDHTAVGAAITTITTGLPQVSRGVRTLAALIDDQSSSKLLEATRKLCTAFSDLLKAAEPATKEVCINYYTVPKLIYFIFLT